jgi:ring-1,2-phenylacetyl-CoA epoxidase subunit PaaA
MFVWRIKSQANEDARQQFLDGYVPQIRELGLEIPDPALRKDESSDVWVYTEPDWDKLKAVVTGHGPASQERLDFRRLSREHVAWVEKVVLAEAA